MSTSDNPADCLSRGQSPIELTEKEAWQCGPDWLKLRKDDWPENKFVAGALPELKTKIALNTRNADPSVESPLRKFSNIRTLTNVVAYIFRFRKN